MSAQIIAVQSGAHNVSVGKAVLDETNKAILSRKEFRKLSADAFTSLLTDLGPGILVTAPYTLTGATEAAQTLATITPGFAGRVSAAFALVTTAATTGSKAANVQLCVDEVAGTNEVQSLAITGTPTGGTFTLTYAGQTTSGIAYNANATAVHDALVALSNIAAGDVVCTGGALPGTAVTITFGGSLAGQDVALIVADGTSLTGGTNPAAAVTTTTAGDPGSEGYGSTKLSGGLLALTSANVTPAGTVIPASTIQWTGASSTYAPWSFSSTGVLAFRTTTAPTAFSEGAVMFGVLLEPDMPVNQLSNVGGPFLV